jgi:ubiquinone/menaquinone biosynthesis C-methylase UbiE
MTSPESKWSASYRLIAAEKWKAKSAAMGRGVTDALVQYANPQPGMKVLDLASGTGEPAISLASKVGDDGHVTALDLSAELLQIADQRAQARDLKNFSTRQADAQQLPFAAHSFDLITCRFGVMFFENCDKALGEALRVLKPGGRICFAAWGPFDQPYWSTTMGIAHKFASGPLLSLGGANMFRFGEPGSLTAALNQSGFVEVDEECKTLPWTWPGPVEEVWEYAQAVSTPFRPMLDRVPEDKWDAVNAEVHQAIRQYIKSEKIEFGAKVVLASGKSPEGLP